MIEPHGGLLVNKLSTVNSREKIAKLENDEIALKVSDNHIQDLENIAQGAFSPLEGFMGEKDFLSVLDNMRLSSGIVWPIPIVLDVSRSDKQRLEKNRKIILLDGRDDPIALVKNPSFYKFCKKDFAQKVFGTTDRNHPGVRDVFLMNEFLVGGRIEYFGRKANGLSHYCKTPTETRNIFAKNKWKTVVAFQTRNVPHRGHEYLQKEALKYVDGLFIQPVIGEKKIDDFKDEYIVGSYETLIKKHYLGKRVMLGSLRLKMRYGGPREAVMHALVRKNFGCTHFIVGRDHAGAGEFYAPDAAQQIFTQFDPGDIGIEIMKFPEVIFDKSSNLLCFVDECDESNRIRFSGTKLRNYVKNKIKPPKYLIRPEVYELLVNSNNSLVDENYKMKTNKKGFVLWFTGLSGAGKSTVADLVFDYLRGNGTKIERLDGDLVRENLAQDLGFTKKDRDENIRRIGFVAHLLSRNGVGVVASFISPYQKQRKELRENVENFIEVYVNAPLEVCERRDPKGLYKKARSGEIKNFTGISDPYEEPKNPEVSITTDVLTPEQCTKRVIEYLEKESFI